MLLAIASEDIKRAGIYLVCLVLSIAVHEYFHALFADRLGDPTPESEGRLTLNPIVHADPIGTLLLPLVLGLWGTNVLFGWGKPVPTQPRHYTRKVSMRTGLAIVAVAGPIGNLVLAGIVLGVAFGTSAAGVLNPQIEELLYTLLRLNLILMAFNLLPLHPLDGGKILAAFLPPKLEHIDEFLMRNGGYILVGLMVMGSRVLGLIFAPVLIAADFIWKAVVV